MALNSTQSRAIAFIDEIYTLSRSRRFPLMITKINNFSIFLYNNSSVIYSNINKYFYQIGLVPILMNYCIYVSFEVAKDILRLLHIFIKTNKNIKDDVSNSQDFMRYLSEVFNTEETWNNIPNFKYHIQIGAYLLMESEIQENFNTSSILRIIRKKIEQKTYPNNNILIYIICYSCLIPISNFDSITNTFKETSLERFFSTSVMKIFVSMIENYLSEFKIFYSNPGNTSDQYPFFLLESEFTFDQICHSLSYYSRQSEQICTNISDNGIYDLINEIFQIKNIPDNLILKSQQFLSIPSLYFQIEEKDEKNDQIFMSVNNPLTNGSFSTPAQHETEQLVSSYFSNESKLANNSVDSSINEIQTISSFEQSINTNNLSVMSNDFGRSFSVGEWLNYNKLNYFVIPFTGLSGKGLYQMKSLLNCSGGRLKLFELLFTNMNIDVVYVLEFLECLDNLKID